MTRLFAPAAALMNRFRYPVKFTLINLFVSLAIGFLAVSLVFNLQTTLRLSQKELAAIDLLQSLTRQVQLTQQHRGLSAGVLGGNEAMKKTLVDKQMAIDMAVADVSQTELRLRDEFNVAEAWQPIQQEWAQLGRSGMNLSAPDNLKAHTGLIRHLLEFQTTVADAGMLTGDPDLDTFYLIDSLVVRLPEMLELLGQTRAKGTGALASQEVTAQQQIDFSVQLSLLQHTLASLNGNLLKAGKAEPHLAGKLQAFSQEISQATAEVIDLVQNDILAGHYATSPEDYFAKVTATIDLGYAQLYDALLPALQTQVQARVDRLERQRAIYIGLAVVVVLLLFWLLSGLYYSVVASVGALSKVTRAMAAGDMTARVRLNTRDELVEVADSVNQMAGSLDALLLKLKDTAIQVGQASATLAESSRAVAQGSRVQSDAAMSMAAGVEEMTAGISTIADHAAMAEQSSVQSGEISTDSARIVEGTVGEMQQIATTVRQSAQIVEELGRNTSHISAIVGAIREIADQTNLLALNAAIEAARAGEQGRGFAVVADEVRKLAERTSQQTGEITRMITAIQAGTENAVTSMQAGVERVAEGVILSQQAGASIAQVREGSEQVVAVVNEISVALREQSLASNEMAENAEHIARMSESNSEAVASVAQTANVLERMAEELQQEVACFRLSH
ncbi:MAG: HAMP domain-containing protein [Sterolibacterium sp.]|nr:HAMP domain-containing protein [Sterolibacterium sp.]